jgi:hypothetical protein
LELETKTKGPSLEKKDSTKPKGVVAAVRFYEKHNRKRIREENKGIDPRGIHKKVSEEWAALDAAGRTPFKHMHEEDKKRFAMEKETYCRSNPNTESKDPTNKPKGVVSAYSFWCRRSQKKHGEKWTALDSAAKSLYVHMHEEDKKRHIMEMVAYQNAFLIFMSEAQPRTNYGRKRVPLPTWDQQQMWQRMGSTRCNGQEKVRVRGMQ